jgi:hypothetical protein
MKRPEPFRGSVVGSFAYVTVKDRLPSILGKVVDFLSKVLHNDTHGSSETIKTMIQKIGELRYNMTRDKSLPTTDDPVWKESLDEIPQDQRSWYKAPWMFIECYTYFILNQMKLELAPDLDLFHQFKEESMKRSIPTMKSVLEHSCNTTGKEKLEYLIHASLWGNEADLSLSFDYAISNSKEKHESIVLNEFSLALKSLQSSKQVTIVLDNAGLELFSDLLLAEHLVSIGAIVSLHFKEYGWFVSDTTQRDFDELFVTMEREGMQSTVLKWKQLIAQKKWILKTHPFWTTSKDYARLPKDLMDDLGELVIFKGDLNYRKMVGDCYWPVDTPFHNAMGCPTVQALMLRTCKSGSVVGVPIDVANALDQEDAAWKENGKYGMIQYHSGNKESS